MRYSEPALEPTAENLCAVYVDMGTTNTRVWLMRGAQVVATAGHATGIRDAARDGSHAVIQNVLRDLIGEVNNEVHSRDPQCDPTHIAASGMITSSLGLTEVPHIQAPAGLRELVAASRWYRLPKVSDLPVLLVPGVRSGPANSGLDSIHDTDVMRGEETLCAGLVALQLVRPPAVVLNLGSHWKAIRVDDEGKIRFSVTSLSGELIHTLQAQTILASSVSNRRPSHLSQAWVEAGMSEQRRSGLPRALFLVRLLDLGKQGSADQRLAFLTGALIAADLDALLSRGVLGSDVPVAIIGHQAIVEAWLHALAQASITARVIAPEQSERALQAALRTILLEAISSSTMEPALHKVDAQ